MLKTEYLPLKDLKPHPKNPRLIKDEAFKKLCNSIASNTQYFEARPIIYSNRTGENIIIAGNMRYRAAKHLKLKEVPAILLPDLTEDKEKEIMIRDNVANGEWCWDDLSCGWDEVCLVDWGLDLPEFKLDVEETEPPERKRKRKKFALIVKRKYNFNMWYFIAGFFVAAIACFIFQSWYFKD